MLSTMRPLTIISLLVLDAESNDMLTWKVRMDSSTSIWQLKGSQLVGNLRFQEEETVWTSDPAGSLQAAVPRSCGFLVTAVVLLLTTEFL